MPGCPTALSLRRTAAVFPLIIVYASGCGQVPPQESASVMTPYTSVMAWSVIAVLTHSKTALQPSIVHEIWMRVSTSKPSFGPPRQRPCPPPWPSGLASIPYEPLRFFYSPPPGPEVAASTLAPGPTTPWLASASHPEELCELEIRIKELELLTITGDGFDSQRCA
ncbi:hypothetical protein PAL_GLEAN10018044 [Pteropus alecto]|uniref:Uncharacterized protein n=1 Tax=Pteropus alecto TaxID=9402 RepID=L5KXX7_PTEAL|nr:hypothetical protein PAL_GLEAN10018044 [Pteropus alecto]